MRKSLTVFVLLCSILLSTPGGLAQPQPLPIALAPLPAPFLSAKPIWPDGREREKNLFVGFHATFEASPGVPLMLRLAGSSLYRITLNGEFVGHGPARGPHGYFRLDEWDLGGQVKPGSNRIAIEVAGYNVNSYYLLDQPAFLQAEVVANNKVLASTGGAGVPFKATILPYRVQKVQRYSFQRPFIEVYRLQPGFDRWKTAEDGQFKSVACGVQAAPPILRRNLPYPRFTRRAPVWDVASGRFTFQKPSGPLWKDRSLTNIGPKLGGYPESELALVPTLDLQKIKSIPAAQIDRPFDAGATIEVPANTYRILDFGTNLTGFPGAAIACRQKTTVYLTFDEILSEGDVDFKRFGCANVITCELEPGEYRIEAFEPYTLRYLKLMAVGGECEVKKVYLREYANPDVHQAFFACSDRGLNRLFEAARETYRQNAVDLFMDCPSRERAGWLCDSFFTSRVAFDLTGKTDLEQNLFQNYLLPQKFAHLPEGMLPMCYPADHNDGVFIPNWALWFVIQLEEYAARGGDRATIDALRPKVNKLFDYFAQYQNADGLLEKLPGWVFVEWSKANQLVQDVNYPTNMLYASALDAAGRLYGQENLCRQAAALRATIKKQSFDGEFFIDNALRKGGQLQVTRERTEVCQYYAFFFGVASPQTHADLWNKLVKDFGPGRAAAGKYPEIYPANAFIGNYLRLELLSRHGQTAQILDESKGYFIKMADKTGTLWEHDRTVASCNHGFASHVAHVLLRDVLGLAEVNPSRKTVTLRFANLPLEWCAATLPLEEGALRLEWHKEDGRLHYRIDVPAGYQVNAAPAADVEIVRHP